MPEGALVALGGLTALPARTSAARPKNAVLIVLDTLRADRLAAYGNPRPTSPGMDAMARAWSEIPHHALIDSGVRWAVRVASHNLRSQEYVE